MMARTGNVLEPGVEFGSPMTPWIHPTAEVSADAVVGDGSRVWHWAQIRERAHVGENCVIGKDVYVDSYVQIGNDCKIENFATIYRGVTIGNRVFVGPHVCFTNDLYPRAVSPDWHLVETEVQDGASVGAKAWSPESRRDSSGGCANVVDHWTARCNAPTTAGNSPS